MKFYSSLLIVLVDMSNLIVSSFTFFGGWGGTAASSMQWLFIMVILKYFIQLFFISVILGSGSVTLDFFSSFSYIGDLRYFFLL